MRTVFRILRFLPGRYFVLPLLGVCFASTLFAQGTPNGDEFKKAVDFLPPAPNAAAIAKAGIFSLNKNTGAPSVNVPLYTLKGRKLAVNVGLSYATNGIKVDEIASRVGMGWSLNAGGVVTRIVRGAPDERLPRKYPTEPVGNNWATYNYMKEVSLSDNTTGVDAQPDLFNFNFNGFSGSFVFDENMHVVQVPYGNLKIEYDFATAATWNFKITTPDGVRYFFGGPNTTEKTKRDNTCGKSFDTYLATSWYLKKIEHPTGDVIIFSYNSLEYTYDNGSSESRELVTEYQASGGNCNFGVSTPQLTASNCVNYTRTQGYYLTDIGSSAGSVHFTYTTRSDCSDVLLSGVSVYNSIGGTNRVKNYDFFYLHANTAPYLSMIKDNSQETNEGIYYQFVYNDPGARPARLSKSQDHWGFYNGKNNSTLLPHEFSLTDPGYFTYYYYFSSLSYADRSPDFEYASKGMLTRIIYPTGGMDSIIYEPNGTGYGPNNVRHKTEYTCEVTGTGLHNAVTKDISFTTGGSQSVTLQIDVICNEAECNDALHNVGVISIAGSTYYQTYATGTSVTALVALPEGAHTLTIQANGTAVTTRVKLIYYAAETPSLTRGVTGGVRVKALLTGNPNERPMYKRYYYTEYDDLEGTSINPPYNPVYVKSYFSRDMTIEQMGSGKSFQQCVHQHTILYSNSLRNLFDYSSNLVSYSSVVESIGENFEGGGTETRFAVGTDQLGFAVWGDDIQDAPMSNNSIVFNGKVLRETMLKKGANGNLFPVKITANEYDQNENVRKSVFGYSVFRKNNIYFEINPDECHDNDPVTGNATCADIREKLLLSFDMMKYEVISPWTYLKSTTETTYDDAGQNPVVVKTDYFYENELHQQVTRTETRNSRNELIKMVNKYPHDYASGSNVYAEMVANNIITPVVDVKSWNNANVTAEVKTNFENWGNGNFAMASIEKSFRGNQPDIEGTIISYDAFGNITEYKGRDGITNAILYGYNYHYPIAKIMGATYAQAVAQLSSGVNALQSMTESQLRTELDRLYTGLPGAFVTTYTYKPAIGVNTITDNNRNTSTFEYDGFGRLHLVRDKDNNVVKTVDYAYAGPDGTLYFKLFFNDAQYQPFTCQNCPYGTVGSIVTYGVPAKAYFSFTSVEDANAKALADIQAHGQANANTYGYCSNTICTGQGYATINCNCELGQIYPVSCSDNPDGTWVQNYKYKWSDNSIGSTIYTRTLPACVGTDKRKVNCNCLAGIKIINATYQNADGTWTCVYHYHWTDGFDSANITEISDSPCYDPFE